MNDMNYVCGPGFRHSGNKRMKDREDGCVIWQDKPIPFADVQMFLQFRGGERKQDSVSETGEGGVGGGRRV